jgi:hypothetical protein
VRRGKGFIVELSGKAFRGEFNVDDFHYEGCRFGFVEALLGNLLVLGEDIEMLDLKHLDDLLWGVSGPVTMRYGVGGPPELKEAFASAGGLLDYCSGRAKGIRYMYHGTSDLNLPSIQSAGLQPSMVDGDDWFAVDRDLPAYCRGKLFLTGTRESAENFFHQKTVEGSARGNAVILRVPSAKVIAPVPDEHEMGSCEVYTLSSIRPELIQVRTSHGWEPLQSLVLGASLTPELF